MAQRIAHATHLDLDDAWSAADGFDTLDLREWGPRLRYHGRRVEVEAFHRQIDDRLARFVLYGSGDFHYLAGVLLRRLRSPATVVSFDNHPDWDVRPPHWACGGWVNRALSLAHVRQVAVWGCGNFELAFPARIFANHRALRSGRLQVHAWAERQPTTVQRRFNRMTRDNWRQRFETFASVVSGQDLYVTVDLDCLRSEEAVTNWENGLFTAEDLAWALRLLHQHGHVVAGDLCGAYSPPRYARRFQALAGRWDHPRIVPPDLAQSARVNGAALRTIWPALAGT